MVIRGPYCENVFHEIFTQKRSLPGSAEGEEGLQADPFVALSCGMWHRTACPGPCRIRDACQPQKRGSAEDVPERRRRMEKGGDAGTAGSNSKGTVYPKRGLVLDRFASVTALDNRSVMRKWKGRSLRRPAQRVGPLLYSGEMTRCESGEDEGYNFCANFKREAALSPRSLLRRSTTSPIGSFTCRM